MGGVGLEAIVKSAGTNKKRKKKKKKWGSGSDKFGVIESVGVVDVI